jgi:two-component system response regulator
VIENQRFILLIADCPDEQSITVRALRQSGICNEIVVVHDAGEAIEFTEGSGRYAGQDTGRLPSLILLDLVCPHVEGHKMLRVLRGRPRTRLIPTVILLPVFDQPDPPNDFGSGANSQVFKPVDSGEFAETLRQVARYWLQINETAQ